MVRVQGPWLPVLADRLSRPCLGLALVAYSLGWLGLTRWRMTRHSLRRAGGVSHLMWLRVGIGGIMAAAFLVVLPAGGWIMEQIQGRYDREQPLVVIARDNVYLHTGNGTDWPRCDVPLHCATEARLLHARGDWLQIEVPGGEVGWVARADALLDTPRLAYNKDEG